MLGHGKLTNIRTTDDGLVAEVTLDGMTPAMVEAAIEQGRVGLELLVKRPPVAGADRAIATVESVLAATVVETGH